jgi:hypothetical protein
VAGPYLAGAAVARTVIRVDAYDGSVLTVDAHSARDVRVFADRALAWAAPSADAAHVDIHGDDAAGPRILATVPADNEPLLVRDGGIAVWAGGHAALSGPAR